MTDARSPAGPPVIEIDPTTVTQDHPHSKLLHRFLRHHERKERSDPTKIKEFIEGQEYKYEYNKFNEKRGTDRITVTFKFTHTLVRQVRVFKEKYDEHDAKVASEGTEGQHKRDKRKKKTYNYTVKSNDKKPIGKGTFGEVNDAPGKLEHTRESMAYTPFSKINKNKNENDNPLFIDKAIKVIRTENGFTEDEVTDIKNEAKLGRIGELAANKPTFIKNADNKKVAAYIRQTKAIGIDLSEYIKQISARIKKARKFTERQALCIELLTVSINLLEALSRLHKKGILHLDIKPRNIKIDSATLKVTILDFGFARKTSDIKSLKNAVGTPLYVAPELLDPSRPYFNQSNDVYSMGRVLIDLWRDKIFQREYKNLSNYAPNDNKIYKHSLWILNLTKAHYNGEPSEFEICESLKECFTTEAWETFENTLKGLNHPNHEERHTLSDSILQLRNKVKGEKSSHPTQIPDPLSKKQPSPKPRWQQILTGAAIGLGIFIAAAALIALIGVVIYFAAPIVPFLAPALPFIAAAATEFFAAPVIAGLMIGAGALLTSVLLAGAYSYAYKTTPIEEPTNIAEVKRSSYTHIQVAQKRGASQPILAPIISPSPLLNVPPKAVSCSQLPKSNWFISSSGSLRPAPPEKQPHTPNSSTLGLQV